MTDHHGQEAEERAEEQEDRSGSSPADVLKQGEQSFMESGNESEPEDNTIVPPG